MEPRGYEPDSRQEIQRHLLPESEDLEGHGHYSFFTELTEEAKLPGQLENVMDIQSLQDWFPAVEEEPYL